MQASLTINLIKKNGWIQSRYFYEQIIV